MSAQRKHQEHLRLVECAACEAYLRENEHLRTELQQQGEAVRAMADRIRTLEDGEDLRNAEKELRKVRRINTRLHNELADKRRQNASYDTALALFEYWKEQLARGPRTKFTEDREKAVLKALQNYSPRYLALAILGAKYAATRGENGVVYDELELVMRGAKPEQFVARLHAYRRKHGLPPLAEESDGAEGDAPGAA